MNRLELKSFLEQEAAAAKANVSVLVRDFASGMVLADINSNRQVVSASTIKTPMMLAALEEVRRRHLSLEQRVPVRDILDDSRVFEAGPCETGLQELLFWMIVNSDNTAANVLMDLLTMKTVNRYCTEVLHLTETSLTRKMLDFKAVEEGRNNYTSAADQFLIFSALQRRGILTPALCETALSILKSNRDYSLALRYIGIPCAVAHKTGGLDHLVHDAGIFYLPGGNAYFFAYLVTEDEDDAGSRLIGRMNRAVFEYFTGK